MITFSGISAARARLAELSESLRAAASGEVVRRAAAKVQAQVDKVAHKYTSAHQASGAADSGLTTTASGGLIQLTASRYLSYHSWWPFRRGMPPFIVAHAVKVFAAELQAAISGQPSPLLAADAAAEEKAAAKSRIAFKKETARIFRQSTEGRAKRKAERAYDRRVKAQEGRE